ncbi:nitroreductase family protein [Paenibacillus sp. Leaf72]|uniref:nitroreductase family protein n=1 Tax=Paenibacillus sp. Leaf72 TaxID=1736234 RepID=UPI0006F91FBD|nr:nitroreductase family protein [Paenibacillus sp. Leaf72]KQO18287.1 hypothetical protein ASF12_06570 [Paenibacillus sp. Leaf72]
MKRAAPPNDGDSGFTLVVVKEEKSKVKRDEDFAAACALIQNFQLCAWEQGIGMLYLGYFDQKPAPGNRISADKKMTWL